MRTNLRRLLPAVLLGGVAMLAGGAATAQDTVFLSTQLRPVEEATKMRQIILRDAPGRVTYVVDEPAPMTTRMQAELRGGTRSASSARPTANC
jgi:multiple sugar transport system substrate-binding protein